MKVPQWLKPAFWGVVVGALGVMIMGFAWGGQFLGSTAERMAKDRADVAVTAILVPICVERFMEQADASAKLAEFQRTASQQQSQVIEKGGWATPTGSKDPNAAVARMCAQQLANSRTQPALKQQSPEPPAPAALHVSSLATAPGTASKGAALGIVR